MWRITILILMFALSGFGPGPKSLVGVSLILVNDDPHFQKALQVEFARHGILVSNDANVSATDYWLRLEGKVTMQAFQSGMDTPFGRMGAESGYTSAWAEANLNFVRGSGLNRKDSHRILNVFGAKQWSSREELYASLAREVLIVSLEVADPGFSSDSLH